MSFVGGLYATYFCKNPIHNEQNIDIHIIHNLMKHAPAFCCQIRFEQIIWNQAKVYMFQSCSHSEHNNQCTITSYSIGISLQLRSLDQWTYDRKGIEDTWNMYTSNKLTFSPPSPSQSPWPPLRARAWWRTLLPRSEGTSWQHPKLLQSLSDFSDHQHVCKSR